MVIDCRLDLHFCRLYIFICSSDAHISRSYGHQLQIRSTQQVGWSLFVGPMVFDCRSDLHIRRSDLHFSRSDIYALVCHGWSSVAVGIKCPSFIK